MRLLPAIVSISAVTMSSAAIAKSTKTSNPTVTKKSVTYRCQQGRHVTVTYGFSKQGLTTSASAVVDGRRRFMPIGLDCSDNAGTYCSKEGSHVLSTAYMDKKTHHKQSVMITAPDDEIVLKDYSSR